MTSLTFKFSYNSQYALDQNHLKVGVHKNSQAELEFQRHKLNVTRQLSLSQLKQTLTIDAYTESVTTVGGLIKLLQSRAIDCALRCMSTYDSNYTKLTKHAERFWKVYTYKKLITSPEILKDKEYKPDFYLAGHIGSLGFLGVKYPYTAVNLNQGLQSIVELFWGEYSLTTSSSIKFRFEELLKKVGYDADYFKACQSALFILKDEKDPIFTRYLLGSKTILDLPQQYLLGEVSDLIVKRVTQLQLDCNRDKSIQEKYDLPLVAFDKGEGFLKETLLIGNGAGFLQVSQAVILEGLLKCINLLNDPKYLNIPIGEYWNLREMELNRYMIASSLISIADGYSIQGSFNSIENAHLTSTEYKNMALQWLASTSQTSIALDNENRLGAFT